MKREAILAVMKTLAPGLVAGDAASLMGCYCCGDGEVVTYNGIIGLRAIVDLGVEGGLPGDKAMAALSACDADEVEIGQKGSEVIIKGGRTRLRLTTVPLPSIDSVRSLFAPDEDEEAVALDWSDEWTRAIKRCLPSISDDPQRPDLIGITVLFQEDRVHFFSATGPALVEATIEQEVEPALVGSSFILPPKYIETLVFMLDRGKCHGMLFGADQLHTVFVVAKQEIHLIGNFIGDAKPKVYRQAIAASSVGLDYCKIPDGFAAAIDRAIVFTGAKGYSDVTIQDGRLVMESRGDCGGIKDTFTLDDHPDVVMRFEPARLKPVLVTASEIAFSEACLSLSGDGLTYFQVAGSLE